MSGPKGGVPRPLTGSGRTGKEIVSQAETLSMRASPRGPPRAQRGDAVGQRAQLGGAGRDRRLWRAFAADPEGDPGREQVAQLGKHLR